MNSFERQIKEHGILASYTFLRLMYSYYVLIDKDDAAFKVKKLLKSLAEDTNINITDLGNISSLSKTDLENRIYLFAKDFTKFDDLFDVVKKYNTIDLRALVFEQKIHNPYITPELNPSCHHYAIARHGEEYLKFNGFSVFVYLARYQTISAHDLVSTFGKLLITPYFLADEVEYEDAVVHLKLYNYLNISTEQIYIYPVFSTELRNDFLFLPVDSDVNIFHMSFIKSTPSSEDFIKTIEKVLCVRAHKEDTDDALAWIMTTQAWTTRPDAYLYNLSKDLAQYRVDESKFVSYIPTDKNFSRFLPALADNYFYAEKASNLLVNYMTYVVGNGATLAIKLEMSTGERTNTLESYLKSLVKYLGHLAEVYKIYKSGKSYAQLMEESSKNCIKVFDDITEKFITIPTLDNLVDILLYFKYNKDENLVNYFTLLNGVYKCLVFNKSYWWELTSPLTGYMDYFIKGISNSGTILVEFNTEEGDNFDVCFRITSNKILFDVEYYVNLKNSTISDEKLNLMFNGKVIYVDSITEQSDLECGQTFNFEKLIVDIDRFCVYSFVSKNCLESSVCCMPYDIALAEDDTIKIADKFFSYKKYSTLYHTLDEEVVEHKLLEVIDAEKNKIKTYETDLFEEAYANEISDSSFR